MKKEELEVLIPSKTVRDYVMETGWTFTDFQKASLLCHRGLPLKDEYSYLKNLGEHTADHTLREQIMEYLGEMDKGFRALRENGGRRYIYVLKLSRDRVLGIVVVVLTALIVVTKAIQADTALDCADKNET